MWHNVIMSCNGYWKSLCEQCGLTGETLAKETALFGGYGQVAMQLLKNESLLRNHLSGTSISFDLGPDTEKEEGGKLSYTLVDPVTNGYCIKLSKAVNSPLTLLRVDGTSARVCGYLENIFPHGFFCILWCTSTSDSVLLHGNNAMWVEFYFPASDPMTPPIITQWDSTLVPVVYNHFSRCKDCFLVVIVSKSMSEDKLWHFNFLELCRDQVKVHHHKVRKKFLPDPSLIDHPLFGVSKIHLYSSHSPHSCQPHSCREHKMLVQFGSVVVQFQVRKSEEYEISDPVHIMCPSGDLLFYSDARPLGKFALSLDKKLVALVVRGEMEPEFQSHIWDLEHSGLVKVVSHSSLDHSIYAAEFVGVGHLYHLVMLKKPECIEMCVQRVGGDGGVVQIVCVDTSSNMREQNEFAHAHSSDDERWLSSLSACPTPHSVFYISKVLFPHGIRAMIREISLLKYGVNTK